MSAAVYPHLKTIKFTRLPVRNQVSHPITGSAEPGEAWSSCYVDEVGFVVG
jgi:hypothetical protein